MVIKMGHQSSISNGGLTDGLNGLVDREMTEPSVTVQLDHQILADKFEVKTFHPTYDEFKNLTKYITSLESQGVHKTGICKIVPPKEWIPRKQGYRLEDIDFDIEKPLKQTLTPEPGSGGVFRFSSSRMNNISVTEYAQLTQLPQYHTPVHESYEELEAAYWETTEAAQFLDPIYGADVNESLTDDDCKVWNVSKLDSILNEGVKDQQDVIPGINNSYLYFGMWAATFSWHVEDMDLYATNYLHYGAPKTWYCIPPEHGYRMELLAKTLFPDWYNNCKNFIRHKICMIHPDILRRHGIPVLKVTQEERNFIVVFPHAYHSGFNHGFNIAEAANFALPRWIEYGKRYRACCCKMNISAVDGQRLSLDHFIRKYQADRYDSWKKGRDFGAHPEDPPEIKQIFENLNLGILDKEEVKIVQKLAVVLEHPILQTPEPVPDFQPVIRVKSKLDESMDWGPSFVEEEFDIKKCGIKLACHHPSLSKCVELMAVQKARKEMDNEHSEEEAEEELESDENKENINSDEDWKGEARGPGRPRKDAKKTPKAKKKKKAKKKVSTVTTKFGFKGISNDELKARMNMTTCTKKHKFRACRKCSGCQTPDCRECIMCLDMTKYGGAFKLKQKCIKRVCCNPTLTRCDDCKWNIGGAALSGK